MINYVSMLSAFLTNVAYIGYINVDYDQDHGLEDMFDWGGFIQKIPI